MEILRIKNKQYKKEKRNNINCSGNYYNSIINISSE